MAIEPRGKYFDDMAIGDIYYFSHSHVAFFIVRSLLELCFFLYLVRPQVRERLRS